MNFTATLNRIVLAWVVRRDLEVLDIHCYKLCCGGYKVDLRTRQGRFLTGFSDEEMYSARAVWAKLEGLL